MTADHLDDLRRDPAGKGHEPGRRRQLKFRPHAVGYFRLRKVSPRVVHRERGVAIGDRVIGGRREAADGVGPQRRARRAIEEPRVDVDGGARNQQIDVPSDVTAGRTIGERVATLVLRKLRAYR